MSILINKLKQGEKEAKEKVDQVEERNTQLQKMIDQLTIEKEAQKQKAETLRKKAEQLMQST